MANPIGVGTPPTEQNIKIAVKQFLNSPQGVTIMEYLWNLAQSNALYKADKITADAAIYKVAQIELLLRLETLGRN